MICLDANYLILGLVPQSTEGRELVEWARSGRRLVTPMPAWYEFICGPVSAVQVQTMRAFLEQIVPFDEPQAKAAATLFNAIHRKRSLRVDAMIAGTALTSGAALATNNRRDFAAFTPFGLLLV